MLRTQIQLTEGQAAKAKRLAAERGVSMAEVIRRLLDAAPEDDDPAERLSNALAALRRGGFRDREGKTDVGRRHDDYLAETLEQDLRKR